MPTSQINYQFKKQDLAFTTKRFEAISSTGVSNGSAYWPSLMHFWSHSN
jgi:hypothetical protein